MDRKTFLRYAAALPGALATSRLLAQPAGDYPDKSIKIVVPYTPGGFNDTMARLFGRKLQEAWSQPVVIENKAGGGTVLGTDLGLKAPPDGYTLLVASFPTVVNQYLFKRLPYDTKKDIAPVIVAGAAPNLLVVRSDSPYRNARDLVAAAKSNPGRLNYASAGNGTSLHLAMEYFKSVSGTFITHIPYKGSAPMINDLLGGQVDVMFDNVPNVLPHIKTGRMRALGVTSLKRLDMIPEVPTIAEQGFPGFEVSPWYGIAAPARTPRPILQKLNAELNRVLAMPDVRALFAAQGVEIIGGSLEDFERYFREQDAKWGPVIRSAGISAD